MNTKTNIAQIDSATPVGNPFLDAFADVGPIDSFVVKKDQVATDMAALMAHHHVSRADLTEKLGWPRSRVSHVLSGKCNLTLKTIHEFTSALNRDYSVVFHNVGVTCFSQPWHPESHLHMIPDFSSLTPSITEAWIVQTSMQTALDVVHIQPLRLGVFDENMNSLLTSFITESVDMDTQLLSLSE